MTRNPGVLDGKGIAFANKQDGMGKEKQENKEQQDRK